MAQTHSLDLEVSSSQSAGRTSGITGLNISGDITWEGWLKVESTSSSPPRHLTTYRQASGNDKGYGFLLRGDQPEVVYYDGSGNSRQVRGNSGVMLTGVWQFLAITVDVSAGTAIFYVNGRSIGTASSSGTATSMAAPDGEFHVGANSSAGNDSYDGLIKDVRVFSDIRTSGEVQSDAHTETVSDANLEGEWNFNNAYTDSSGNGNDLTSNGSPVFSTSVPWDKPSGVSGSTNLETNLQAYWGFDSELLDDTANNNDLTHSGTATYATGKQDNGLDLEVSSSEYASISDASQTGLDLASDFGFMGWVKTESLAADMQICGKSRSGDANDAYELFIETSGDLHGSYKNTGVVTQFDAAAGISNGSWYHFAVTADISAAQYYVFVNGVEIAVTMNDTGATSIRNNGNDFEVGAFNNEGTIIREFDGIIDELAVYSRLLHYGDVLDHYNDGSGINWEGGTAYTQDINEALTLVDTNTLDGGKAIDETITLVETVALSAGRLVSEALTLVETVATNLILNTTITETITLVETTTAKVTAKLVSETLTLVDTVNRSLQRTITEAITLVENVDTVISKGLTDVITLVESIGTKITAKILTETITLVESVSTAKTVHRTITEVVTLVENVTLDTTIVISESLTLVDSIIRDTSKAIEESISLVERIFNRLNGVNVKWVDKYASKAGTWVGKYINPK